MDLVYLWVEEYKNIYRQGFNFSPKFRCDYDPDTNELTIEKNESYIENFFGKDISVTAIVGKNGSGKSSIVKLLFLLFYVYQNENEKFFFEDEEDEKIKLSIHNLRHIFRKYKENKFFLIIKYEGGFFKIDFEQIKQKIIEPVLDSKRIEYQFNPFKIEKIKDFSNELDIFNIYYNISTDILKDDFFDEWIEDLYHRQDQYELPLLIEPAKYNDKIDIRLTNTLSNQRLLLFYSNFKSDKQVTKFFNPNRIKFDFATSKIDEYLLQTFEDYNNELFGSEETAPYASEDQPTIENITEKPYKIIAKYISFLQGEEQKGARQLYEDINFDFLSKIYSMYENKSFKELNLLYLIFKLVEKKNLLEKNSALINSLETQIMSSEPINAIELLENSISEIILGDITHSLKKIQAAINFHNKKLFENLPRTNTIQIEKLPNDILDYFPAWLEVEFFEDYKSLNSLSTGEKFKFKFLISLLYHLHNLLDLKKYNHINIFFDEIEMGFHPEWQKSFLTELIYLLENFPLPVNLVFLTHSPFLLSDIPKQNIIFLDVDEEGNCKVIKDDKAIKMKHTFGANIHTLLSDSFFMKNGLMGEFAKGKIEEVIDIFRQDIAIDLQKLNQVENTISIIGEPLLQNRLKKMLISYKEKHDLLSEKEKELIRQIEKLQQQLNEERKK